MALIKCEECGKEISDKAHSCPHCGFPLDDYKEEKKENKKEISTKVIKEVITIKSLIISLGLCFILFILLLVSPTTMNNRTYNLVSLLMINNVFGIAFLYGFSVFIGFILSIINKTTMKVSKLFYIQSLLLYLTMIFILYENETFISYAYIINFVILSVIIILPNKFRKKEHEIYVTKEEQIKIEKNNKKILKDKPYFSKLILIITGIILLIILLITSYLLLIREKQIDVNHITSYSIKTSSKKIKITITTEELKVRSCDGFDCKTIGTVQENDEFIVNAIMLNDGYRWYFIEDSKGNKGYVGSNNENNYVNAEYFTKNNVKESYLKLNENYDTTIIEEPSTNETTEEVTDNVYEESFETYTYDNTSYTEPVTSSKDKFINTLTGTFGFTSLGNDLYSITKNGYTFYINMNNNSIYQPTGASGNITEQFVEYNYRSHAGRVITKTDNSGEEIITIVEYYADVSNGLIQCSTNPTKYKSAFCSDSETSAKLIKNLKKQIELYISSAGVNEAEIYGSSNSTSYTGSLTPKEKVDTRTSKEKIVDVLTSIGYTKVDDNTYKKGTDNSYYEFSFNNKYLMNYTYAIGVKTFIIHSYTNNMSSTLMIEDPNIQIGNYKYYYSDPYNTFSCNDTLCPSSNMRSSITKAGNALKQIADQILSDAGVSSEEFNNI